MNSDQSPDLDKEMHFVQQQIKNLTETRPPCPLPVVPMLPNLARGSSEMWQIYQYQLKEHQDTCDLPTEREHLVTVLGAGASSPSVLELLSERLNLLDRKDRAVRPVLCQPTTCSRPVPHEQKADRARLIARHIKQEAEPSVAVSDTERAEQIRQLQLKLMDLEEQYLDSENGK